MCLEWPGSRADRGSHPRGPVNCPRPGTGSESSLNLCIVGPPTLPASSLFSHVTNLSGISGHVCTKLKERNKLLSAFHPLAPLDKDRAVEEMGKGSRNQNYLCSLWIAFP